MNAQLSTQLVICGCLMVHNYSFINKIDIPNVNLMARYAATSVAHSLKLQAIISTKHLINALADSSQIYSLSSIIKNSPLHPYCSLYKTEDYII